MVRPAGRRQSAGPPVVAIVEGPDVAVMDAVIDRMGELPMVTGTQTRVIRDISETQAGPSGKRFCGRHDPECPIKISKFYAPSRRASGPQTVTSLPGHNQRVLSQLRQPRLV